MIDPACVVTANFWIDKHRPFSRPKLKVCGSLSSSGADSQVTRSPVYSIMRAPLGMNCARRRPGRAHRTPRTSICTARCRALAFFAIRSAESSLLLTSAWAVTALFFNGRRYFQVFPGTYNRIGGALLQISREVQLVPRSERPLLIASPDAVSRSQISCAMKAGHRRVDQGQTSNRRRQQKPYHCVRR